MNFPFNLNYVVMTIINGLLLWVVFILIFSAILKWLWNNTITGIFGLRQITFWEALRLMIIAALIFGNGPGFNLRF